MVELGEQRVNGFQDNGNILKSTFDSHAINLPVPSTDGPMSSTCLRLFDFAITHASHRPQIEYTVKVKFFCIQQS